MHASAQCYPDEFGRATNILKSASFFKTKPRAVQQSKRFMGGFCSQYTCLATTRVVQIMRNLLVMCTHAIEIHVFKVEGVDVAGKIAVSFSRIS